MDADRLAPWYRWIEYAAFGRALERARFAFLDELIGSTQVLVLGEGDGRTLERLLTIAPAAHFDVFDSSAKMIALAGACAGRTDRVHFFREDARLAHFAERRYDAVVTNFFLDCFTTPELQMMLQKIAPALKPKGIWIVSEFTIPSSGIARGHAKVWIWVMYRFFALTTSLRAGELPPIERLLAQLGLRRLWSKSRRWGLVVSEVWIAPR